jgi:DNA mismatch endonuclease (patch repair protein)
MDSLSKSERSEVMSRVRSKNSRLELLVRSYLHRNGLRFRIHNSKLPGKPDLTLPKYKAVVFINGCFWHRHPDPNCKFARIPKSNVEFWQAKLSGNRKRDMKNRCELHAMGWRVFDIWECQLEHPEDSLKSLLSGIASV